MSTFNPELFDADAFWRNVAQIENGCWLWLRHKASMRQCGHTFPVRHIAYALTFGAVPCGRALSCTCGNEACVNPAHLKLGRRMAITDEFSGLAVSRQRKHQLRRQKAGLCLYANCPNPPLRGSFCKEHAELSRERQRKRMGCVKRYRSLSYE